MPELCHLLFYLLRLIQNYAAIGIRGEKVAASVADGKHTILRRQQLQWLPGFRARILLSFHPPARKPEISTVSGFFRAQKRTCADHFQTYKIAHAGAEKHS